MHLPRRFRPPRLNPLACLALLLGGLPLAALGADQEGDAAAAGRAIPLLPPRVSYVLAQADVPAPVPAPVPAQVQPQPSALAEEPVAGVIPAAAEAAPTPVPALTTALAPALVPVLAPEPTLTPEPAATPAATPLTQADHAADALVVAAAPGRPSAPRPPLPAPLPATLPSVPADSEPPAGEPLVLKKEEQFTPERVIEDHIPVFVQGEKISGQTGVQTVIEGDAELRKRGSLIKAETITYWPVEDEMLARTNVRALKNGDLFTGPELRLKLDAQTGYFLDVNYLLANEKARGTAKRLDFLGTDAYTAEDASYTTCGPGNDAWFLQVGKLNLDYGRDLGEAENAKIVFMGVPVLSVPDMSFTLNDRRKSGFLAPSFGSTIQSGQEFSLPYYWNIAPNRDMTITERVMSKRGLQSSAAFRYLGADYKGQINAELLPDDNLTKTTRSGISVLHTQTLYPGLSTNLNLNKVSDNAYFTDLSARLALTAQTYLPREGSLNYANTEYGYTLNLRAQAFQTLQDPLAPVTVPYFRLPELSFVSNRYDVKGFDLGIYANYTRFASATQVMGSRSVINPSISYPVVTPGFYVTPTLAINSTRYHLQDVDAWQTGVAMPGNAQSFITRNLPIFNIDSGMTFEKKTSVFGKDYTQTLEPRLYYLRVPYRDQSNIPIFDTALPDFNFTQIFTNNLYSGYDRIADANQLTAAVSTRLLNADTGGERLRAIIGQRFYFTSQQVTLPGELPRVDKTSDFLAGLSGDIIPHLRFDSAVEYNPNQKQIQRVSHGIRWSPQEGNTVSAAYRYQRDLLEQVDVAGQWRVAPRWYGVGRYNFSIRDGRVAEAVAGFEYDGDCWVGRVVLQRYALATQKASTSIFFQIELNGLSRLGSNPLDVLRRNIPGYTKLNDNQITPPRTFNNYE